jgi:hypothetical protein
MRKRERARARESELMRIILHTGSRASPVDRLRITRKKKG